MRVCIIAVVLCGCPTRPEPPAPAIEDKPIAIAPAPILDRVEPLLVFGDPRLRNRSRAWGFALNADRTRLAVTHERTIRVWNVPEGTLAFEIPRSATMPHFVGDTLAALVRGGATETMWWWNAHGREVAKPVRECTGVIAVGPKHRACLAADVVFVFGARRATWLVETKEPFEHAQTLALSPDGKWLAVTTTMRLHVYDLERGERAWVRDLRVKHDCLAFDAGSRLLVAYDETLAILDAGDGSEITRRSASVESCDLSPLGDRVVVVGSGQPTRIEVLSVFGLEPLAQLPTGPMQLERAKFSADGNSLWVPSDGNVVQWNLEAKSWRVSHGHVGNVNALALSPDGKTVATAGADGQLILWPLNGDSPRTLRGLHDLELTAVAYSLDGEQIAVAAHGELGSEVSIWSVPTGAPQIGWKHSGEGLIRSLGFSGDGRTLFALDNVAELVARNVRSAKLIFRRTLYDAEATETVFDARATKLIAELHYGKGESHITIESMKGKPIYENGAQHYYTSERPQTGGFTRDGAIWMCSGDPCVPTDPVTGEPIDATPVIDVYAPDDPAYDVPRWHGKAIVVGNEFLSCHAFHPDGKRFISCSPDGLVRVWDLASLRACTTCSPARADHRAPFP